MSYGEYLQLDLLLAAQKPRSEGDHDEMLFIIIHQTYELWFKQLLHEGSYLAKALAGGEPYTALATIDRMRVVLKTLVGQTDILETMTPLSFASFRHKLEQASGFQSKQFRKVEFLLGFKNADKVKHDPSLQSFLEEPSLYDRFLHFLAGQGNYPIPEDVLKRDFSQARLESDPRVEEILLTVYKHDPKLRLLCEKFVDFDEGFQEWRYRHVKMVERTIGNKMGTGGSSGVDYLQRSLFRPAFPELWKVRNYF